MNMSNQRSYSLLLALLAATIVGTSLAGCNSQRGLFSDDDITTRNRLRYFEGESARETTESRRQSSGMGFGFPTGGGAQ